jgi:hypothetical protein
MIPYGTGTGNQLNVLFCMNNGTKLTIAFSAHISYFYFLASAVISVLSNEIMQLKIIVRSNIIIVFFRLLIRMNMTPTDEYRYRYRYPFDNNEDTTIH